MPLYVRNLFLISSSLIIILLLCLGFWLQSFITTAVGPAEPQVIEIKPGSSFARIAQQLADSGIVSDAGRFILLARWRQTASQVHAGQYQFESTARPDEILDRLVAGDIRKFQTTIPEGFNLRDIAARLGNTGIGSAEEFLALCYDAEFLKELAIEATSLEGYLFPETYTYTASTAPRQLLKTMVAQLQTQLTPELLASAATVNLDRHQLLTMASIIEKEAGNVTEMPVISSVFHNRLRLGIPLQADPTVIYGIADFNGNLTKNDLLTATPYNTYTTKGLPPGPIASPGREAIAAVLNPAPEPYLYFVARNDGSHYFSATLAEHNRAVERFQKQKKQPRR